MASEKITAMPDLAGGQVPSDLVTAVDLSAIPASQNVKSTLNDLFATITKNITDRALRFQAPGTAPTVSAANQGSIYHNGTTFLASSNGGAYEQVYTLAAQTAALVFAGPTTGGPAIPTFRALALTDLPTQTGTGNIVLATNPVMTNPTIDIGITGVSSGRILGFQPVTSGVNYVDVYNAISSAGPTLHAAGTATNIQLNLHAKGTGIVACVGNALRITGSTTGANGIIQARGGTTSGGVLQLYELTTNGTNWVGFRSPDLLAANLEFELPATDGSSGQVISTNGAGVLGWGWGRLPSSSQSPTTSNPTVTINSQHFINLSGLTANRNFVLPAGAVGDVITISITEGDADYAMLLIGASGISINGGSAATEWSRLFITGESVTFVANSTTNWQVLEDGRIPSVVRMYYSGAAISIPNGVDTQAVLNIKPYDNASMGNTSTYNVTIRRTNKYILTGGYGYNTVGVNVARINTWIGTATFFPTANEVSALSTSLPLISCVTTVSLNVNAVVGLWTFQLSGGSLNTRPGLENINLAVTEVLT